PLARAMAQTQCTNAICTENQATGTDQWLIPNAAGTAIADDTGNQIKGYTSAASVRNDGSDPLTFFVTVNPPQTFTIDLYRLGWSGGLGGRLMQHLGPFTGVNQGACPVVDSATQLVACSWSASYALTVPATWTDGVYMAVLTNANKY